MVTAMLLIASGIGLLRGGDWTVNMNLLANGMLIYTSIVSPGYFAQKRQWLWLAMFLLIIALSLASIVQLTSML